MNQQITGQCPTCEADVKLATDVVESEIVTCPDCQSELVVSGINKPNATLEQAPDVEEDWGE